MIDRTALVQEIEKLLPQGFKLSTDNPTDLWEKAILVCGCPTTCADKPAVRDLARRWVLIGGPMIDREMVPEESRATVIVQKLQTKDL